MALVYAIALGTAWVSALDVEDRRLAREFGTRFLGVVRTRRAP